jgi:hypothetical protein
MCEYRIFTSLTVLKHVNCSLRQYSSHFPRILKTTLSWSVAFSPSAFSPYLSNGSSLVSPEKFFLLYLGLPYPSDRTRFGFSWTTCLPLILTYPCKFEFSKRDGSSWSRFSHTLATALVYIFPERWVFLDWGLQCPRNVSGAGLPLTQQKHWIGTWPVDRFSVHVVVTLIILSNVSYWKEYQYLHFPASWRTESDCLRDVLTLSVNIIIIDYKCTHQCCVKPWPFLTLWLWWNDEMKRLPSQRCWYNSSLLECDAVSIGKVRVAWRHCKSINTVVSSFHFQAT